MMYIYNQKTKQYERYDIADRLRELKRKKARIDAFRSGAKLHEILAAGVEDER